MAGIHSIVELEIGDAKGFVHFQNRPWRALIFTLKQRIWHRRSARLAWGESEAEARAILDEAGKE